MPLSQNDERPTSEVDTAREREEALSPSAEIARKHNQRRRRYNREGKKAVALVAQYQAEMRAKLSDGSGTAEPDFSLLRANAGTDTGCPVLSLEKGGAVGRGEASHSALASSSMPASLATVAVAPVIRVPDVAEGAHGEVSAPLAGFSHPCHDETRDAALAMRGMGSGGPLQYVSERGVAGTWDASPQYVADGGVAETWDATPVVGSLLSLSSSHQEVESGVAALDMGALRKASCDKTEIETMSTAELSRMVAASMVGFDDSMPARAAALSACLNFVFQRKSIMGDSFVGFPEDDLLRMIVSSLNEIATYTSFGEDVNKSFEWRLQRLLFRLRRD